MADINLLQSESHDIGSEVSNIARIFARLLVIVVALAIVAYGVMYFFDWSAQKSLEQTKASIQTKQSEIMANKDRNELVTRQEQLQQLETLIDNHLYWSYLMPELARVTLKSGRYANIEATSDGKLNLTVNLPSYEDVEKYLQIFDLPEYNQQFSNVRIVNINKVQTDTSIEIQLTVQLTFNPAFIKGRI